MLLIVQLVMWVVVLVAASRLSPSTWRRWRGGGRVVAGGPVVTLHEPIVRPGGVADPLWRDAAGSSAHDAAEPTTATRRSAAGAADDDAWTEVDPWADDPFVDDASNEAAWSDEPWDDAAPSDQPGDGPDDPDRPGAGAS